MEIRYITHSDDRLAISKIYEESWKHAYKGIIPQEYLDSIPGGDGQKTLIYPAGRHLFVLSMENISVQAVSASLVLISFLIVVKSFLYIFFLNIWERAMGKSFWKLPY